MLRVPSLQRLDLNDRRTQLILAGVLAAGICTGMAVAVGSGDLQLALLMAGFIASPLLVALAINRPYVFPYGLYVALVPFDDLLKISAAGTLTKLLGGIATLCIAVYAFRSRRVTRPPLAVYAWVAYIAWMLLSLLWTVDASSGMLQAQTMGLLVLMFVILTVAPIDERQLRVICGCIVAGGVAASLYGIWTLHNMPTIVDPSGTYRRLAIRFSDVSIDPNHFANALLLPFALALTWLVHARSPRTLFAALVACGVLAAGILSSLSREALLGCVIIAVVLVWFSRRKVLAAAVGIPVLAFVPLFVPAIAARMAEAFATGGAGRMSIWQVGLAAWRAHPLIGWGEGSSFEAYDRYYLRVYQAYNAGWTRPPHSTALSAMVDLGVIGLVLLVVAFVATVLLLRRIRRGDSLYDLRVGLTAGLAALAFTSFFIDLTSYKYLWIALATAAQLWAVARAHEPRYRT